MPTARDPMRLAWVGFHAEGIPALEALLQDGAPIHAALTLAPEVAAQRSGGADYWPVCTQYGVPLHFISNINEPQALDVLRAVTPDVVFVIGWPQIVRPPALRLARLGMIGAHASRLPHNRGSAPINWAVIRRERESGNTLFWLSEDVDAGDIIDQTTFSISPYDTCATLYRQVALSNRDMLRRLLPRLLDGERPGWPQPRSTEPLLPRRRPADGQIDWRLASGAVYDVVRALTRPCPGAFGVLDGQRWTIWKAALPWIEGEVGRPGDILGPVVSPVPEACGQLVACGHGGLILLEVESGAGEILRGPDLSDQPWAGKRWKDTHARTSPMPLRRSS